MRCADLVVPGSEAARDVSLRFGAESDRVLVMPWPVPWLESAKVTDLPSIPTVLFAGRLVREKGVDLILRAMVYVKEEIANCPSTHRRPR